MNATLQQWIESKDITFTIEPITRNELEFDWIEPNEKMPYNWIFFRFNLDRPNKQQLSLTYPMGLGFPLKRTIWEDETLFPCISSMVQNLVKENHVYYAKRLILRKSKFDASITPKDSETIKKYLRRIPNEQNILACIAGDAIDLTDTFQDFCDNFGYGNDSIKALQTFNNCMDLSKRIHRFFTIEEITELQEIIYNS